MVPLAEATTALPAPGSAIGGFSADAAVIAVLLAGGYELVRRGRLFGIDR